MSSLVYYVEYMTPKGVFRMGSADRAKILRVKDAVAKQGKWYLLTMRDAGRINAHSLSEGEIRALETERRDNYARDKYRTDQHRRMNAGLPLWPDFEVAMQDPQFAAFALHGYDIREVPAGVYPFDWIRVFKLS